MEGSVGINSSLVDFPFVGKFSFPEARIVLVNLNQLPSPFRATAIQNQKVDSSMHPKPTAEERKFYSLVTRCRKWINGMFKHEAFVEETLDSHLKRVASQSIEN